MKTIENRRNRLKAWFKGGPLPEREKSYLSQLITGKSSFGEKAARRIEKDYRMPPGYLDEIPEHGDGSFDGENAAERPLVLDEHEKKLVSLYRTFPDATKQEMLSLFNQKSKEFERLFEELVKIRKARN